MSQCVTAERASMGTCVHFAWACLMISKQPGIDCRPDARATSSLLAESTLSHAVVAQLILVHIKRLDERNALHHYRAHTTNHVYRRQHAPPHAPTLCSNDFERAQTGLVPRLPAL